MKDWQLEVSLDAEHGKLIVEAVAGVEVEALVVQIAEALRNSPATAVGMKILKEVE